MIDKLQVLEADTLLRQVEGLHPEALEQVQRVVAYAIRAHGDQLRASGESFMIHPLAVAEILAELHMDTPTIVAGVLHDVVEDTDIPIEEVREQFGEEVALLVEGVSKLRRVKLKSKVEEIDLDEEQAENLRKMFLAMVDDIRVVIIKLADRLHNVRTLQYLPPEKQLRKARETLDIYAPLAERLGIWQLKWQLEDLSFRYIDPERYREIAELLAQRRAERAEYLDRVISVIRVQLEQEGIQARLSSRPKHIYSIHKKMQEKSRDFGEIYDVHGVRIIVDQVRDCYHALGVIHALWRPIPGEFDDYIAMPKDNLYQSLHTAVVALDGRPLEVQIRTEEMHQVAEYGVAAHWRYKEGTKRDETLEAKVNWLRQASDWRDEVEDAQQFVDSLKSDVIAERVYVFTPKGDIIDLPVGATPIDFAYEIHTEIGHRCRGAKVDGRLVPLDHQLQNGEQVEILTVKEGGPSRDWVNPQLNYVATQRARQKISQWFRRQQREQNITDGRDILDREMRRLGIDQETYAEIAALFKYGNVQDFMAAVGYGDISPSQIARRIDEAADKNERLRLKAIPDTPITDIQVMGVGDLLTRMAPCCKPVPGDAIVGYTTRGKGVTVHRADCPNIVHLQDVERLIPVSWGKPQQAYPVPVVVEGFDRSGLLRDIASAVADLGLSMSSANVYSNRDATATIRITVGVRGVGQLSALLNKLQSVHDVLDARRERTA
jgi:GTP diphosphokinase / guanosine-3',5'-bis(diphosphate) 3'-diphosphatase